MNDEPRVSIRVTAFLAALPHARDDEFVSVPGLATWRAKHVRRAIEREVMVVHNSGYGFAFLVPPGHVGMCPHCAAHANKGGAICEHCACLMCSWIRTADERASPRVSRARWQQLIRQLQTFRLGGAPRLTTAPLLDDDL